MAWVIVQFSDQTVSCVPKKWLTKVRGIKMCYYPKSGAAKKIKAAVDVDVKSKDWKLYSYRLLMEGEEFETYFAARKAEVIAQNYSTMRSFEESYALKQEKRKRPVVHFGSSSPGSSTSGSEHQDFQNIKKLSKLDAGLAVDMDKVYHYTEHPGKNNNGPLPDEQLSDSDDEQSLTNDEFQCLKNNGSKETDNDSDKSASEGSNEDKNGFLIEDDVDLSIKAGDDFSTNDDSSSDDGNEDENFSYNDGHSLSEEDENNHSNRSNENVNIQSQIQNNFPLESTNEHEHRDLNISPVDSGYQRFSDERRIPQIERAVMSACQMLEENAKMVEEIRQNSRETKLLVESMIPIVKDLTVEVFDSKEEIKKRNGLFTDVLTPKIQLPIKKVKRFEGVELALKNHKIVDNMIKYLGSTINESDEKMFIKRCFEVVFEENFFMNKVWWKRKPGKVLIKYSMILHCIRESFKAKFGLVEPIRSDKTVNDLIHKTCRNVKDNIRKAIKAKEKEMAAIAAKQSKLDQGAKKISENPKNGGAVQEDEAKQKKNKTAAKKADDEVKINKSKIIPGDGESGLIAKGKKFMENAESKKAGKKLTKIKKDKQGAKTAELNGTDQKAAEPAKKAQKSLDEINVYDGEEKSKKAKKLAKKIAKLEKAKQDAEEAELNGTDQKAAEPAKEAGNSLNEINVYDDEEKSKKAKKLAKKIATLEKGKQNATEDVLNGAGEKRASQEGPQNNAYVKKANKSEKIKHAKTV